MTFIRLPALGASLKTAVVTGANSGVGLETARGLALRGYHVVLAVRSEEKGRAAAEDIGPTPGATEVMHLDVADLESVRAFAREVQALHVGIDLLVNNAGIHTARRERSPQGHEMTFATNHLGHFLLTHELLPALRLSPAARIVNVASEAHRYGRIDLDDLMFDRKRWSGILAYTQSKLANVMFTYALARRLQASSVVTNAVHPGSVRSGWARGAESGLFRFVAAASSPFLISPEKGARTSLRLSTDPALARVSGKYFLREQVAQTSRVSRDVATQEALWRRSAELAGVDWV